MKHGGVKAKCFVDYSASKMTYIVSDGAFNSTHSLTFVDHFVKMKVDAKTFVWHFFAHLVNKADGTLKDLNSVYCNNCL